MHRSILALVLSLLVPAVAAQDNPAPAFTLELNALQPADAGCRVTFLATNELGSALERASVEMALFDGAGTIERIVTLDFKHLAPNKTKVLQFELAGLDCGNLGRLLINDITACEGPGLPAEACLTGLATVSRPDILFGV